MEISSPVLLVVFNRPQLTEWVIERLKSVKVKRLFIASDGPRKNNINDEIACNEIASIINKIDWVDEIHVLRQPENLGCGKAVSSAISWFFSHVESGIILEDDCLPSPTFFHFCEKALVDFREDYSVWHVDGSNFNPHSGRNLYEYSKFPLIWGWATWKDRWEKYQYVFTSDEVNKIIAEQFTDLFQRTYWRNRLKDFFNNRVDTWDYQWMLTTWKHNGIVVRPPQNLIRNTGFEGNGTHTIDKTLAYLSLPEKDFEIVDYTVNRNVAIDEKSDNQQFLYRFMRGSKLFKYLFYINDNFLKK